MAISPYKSWIDGESLNAADLNASFLQITNNGQAVPFPRTATADFDGFELIIDADADSTITADTDDLMDFRLQGQDLFKLDGTTASAVNGLTVLMGAAGSPVSVKSHGADTNINILLDPKGSGVVDLDGATLTIDADADSTLRETSDDVIALRLQGIDAFIFDGDAASAANGLTFTSAADAADVKITGQGSSTDISVSVLAKGSGTVKIGAGTGGTTATPTAAAVPVANGSGKLADGWISLSSVQPHAGLTPLASYAPSGAASVDITSVITATYQVYEIYFRLIPSVDGAIIDLRTDTDNGASFDSSVYDFHTIRQLTTSTVTGLGTTAGGANAALSLIGATGVGNEPLAGENIAGRITILSTGSASAYPLLSWSGAFIAPSNACVSFTGGGTHLNPETINALQIFPDSGTISGRVHVFGVKTS